MSSLLQFLFSLLVPKGMEATLLCSRGESNANKWKGNEVKIDREEAEMEGRVTGAGVADSASSGPFPFFFFVTNVRVYMNLKSAL